MNLLLPIAFLLMAQAGPTQPKGQIIGQIPADMIAVKNLTIGSLRSRVLSVLGKPSRSRRGYDSDMGMGKWEEMHFPGLVVEVTKPEPTSVNPGQKEAHVWRMIITGKGWSTKCGLRIGQTREQAISALGQPASEESKGTATVLHYFPKVFDGFLWVELRNDIVTEIGVAEDWT
ncbi:MAG: hypothetical protein HXX12_14795 [Geothrix sp.]|uniref:hypothetical protein n=1 Tax=Geothrix sp. TaxID=1962974 RepID=UPI0017BE97FE|nr:hypothetical protein [Geothrix sp.]NWJ42229.1 hypothetical protein [Geothrix sp.]WIL19808.1 MAG: hypothetical protein QOZ81_002341 [Geothrix sp.]